MEELLTLLLVGLASALVPLVNIEAYLAVLAAIGDVGGPWWPALAAATGQMAGKLVWYWLGATSLEWDWVRRRLRRPKTRARIALWRARTHQRPVVAGAVVLLSAFSGLPPFAVVAVVAGQLRMSLLLFMSLGLAGRWLRFTAVLGGVTWLAELGLIPAPG